MLVFVQKAAFPLSIWSPFVEKEAIIFCKPLFLWIPQNRCSILVYVCTAPPKMTEYPLQRDLFKKGTFIFQPSNLSEYTC